MPKQPPKNGYYYFMLDFRTREEGRGRRFRDGMKEVAEAASDEWKQLSQDERDDYNKYAKEQRPFEERKNVVKSSERKFNSQGVSFAQLEREKKAKEARENEIKTFVASFVQRMDIDDLKNKPIHLIHVNIFCCTDDGLYYPAELAICKFNMKEGFLGVFHTFFDPGEITIGYSYAIKEHSEKTHKLTLPFVKKNCHEKMYDKIYDNIISFLEVKKYGTVPLFTMYDDVHQNTSLIAVEKTLETLWDSKHSSGRDRNEGWRKFYPVYPLPLLFQHLKNTCFYRKGYSEDSQPFPNSVLAASELNQDTYNFTDEYACKFHQEEDAVVFCSSSYVRRWAQIIRDHCCTPLDLTFGTTESTYAPSEYNECKTYSESDYRTAASTSFCNDDIDDEDDDDYEDNQSVISKCSARTAKTVFSEKSVGFARDDKPNDVQTSSTAGSTRSGAVWQGARSRQQNKVPSLNNNDFPALGGMGRGMRRLNLNQ